MADDNTIFTMVTEVFPKAVRVTFLDGDNRVSVDLVPKDAKSFGFELMRPGYRSEEDDV